MFEDSLTYLRDGDDAVRTILVGGLLSVLGFLIVPAVLVQGYVLRVLGRVADGDTDPPAFDDWGALAVDGVKALVVAAVYAVVPVVLAVAFVGGGVAVADSAPLVGALAALVGAAIVLVTAAAALYVAPAALVRLARSGRVGAAFEFDALRPVLARREYATGWLMALGVLLAAGLLGSALAAVPVVGWLAAVFVGFYAQVTAAYLYATSYAEASDRGLRTEPDVDEGRPVV